jgi:hypothetical protein
MEKCIVKNCSNHKGYGSFDGDVCSPCWQYIQRFGVVRPEMVDNDDPNYEKLATVLTMAYDQAAKGKGAQRHGRGQPFEDQPMQTISKLLNCTEGMAFQAIKKIQESQRMARDPAVRELLGAINYVAGMVVYLHENEVE